VGPSGSIVLSSGTTASGSVGGISVQVGASLKAAGVAVAMAALAPSLRVVRRLCSFRLLVPWSLGRNSPLQRCLLEVNSRSCVVTLRRRWPPCVLCGQEQHSKRWCGVSCSWSSHARIAICWWRGSTDGVWCLHGHWGPCQPCGWCVQHRVLVSTRDRGGWEDTGRQ
jgi:hypothetical protein